MEPKDHIIVEDEGHGITVLPEPASLESVFASIPKLQFDYEDGDLERIAWDEHAEEYKKKFGPS
jgi:hypothetical protein